VTFSTDAIPNQFSGVDVDVARAAVDRYLQGAVYTGAADASGSSVIADALSHIDASLGAPGDNISFANKLDDAFAALTVLSAAPNSAAAKADALFALDDAFAAFGRTQDAIAAEDAAALSRLEADVTRANALLEEIYRLNQVVPDSAAAADLLDQRLTELSSLVSINVVRGDDGRVEVATPGGTLLANSAGYSALGVAAGPPTLVTFSSVDPASGAATLVNGDFGAAIVSGEINGLLTLKNVDLPRIAALVEATARGVADQLNAVYAGNAVAGSSALTTGPLIAETNGVFAVDAALLADPDSFAIARPSGGAVAGANDGSGAAALANVSSTGQARAVADVIAQIGSTAKNAALSASTDRAISAELAARASAEGGVNLDEELSNLILYQRAYAANARVISAVDELWQSLLQIL
jgi:flagellar hook-associated protein 1 FlgK